MEPRICCCLQFVVALAITVGLSILLAVTGSQQSLMAEPAQPAANVCLVAFLIASACGMGVIGRVCACDDFLAGIEAMAVGMGAVAGIWSAFICFAIQCAHGPCYVLDTLYMVPLVITNMFFSLLVITAVSGCVCGCRRGWVAGSPDPTKPEAIPVSVSVSAS